jgi:hypothetical protein
MPTNSESSTKVYKFSEQLSGLKKCGNVDIPGIANTACEFLASLRRNYPSHEDGRQGIFLAPNVAREEG